MGIYDWKMPSYQPNGKVSLMRPISASTNPFSLVMARWIGIKQKMSATHSPLLNVDTESQTVPSARAAKVEVKSPLTTIKPVNILPIGFFVFLCF
jgi:hypothetical protein